VVGVLKQVPNEKMVFAGDGGYDRTEDEIIAYTYDKFMTTGDETWPLLLPMAKSAVKAMDAITDFCSKRPAMVNKPAVKVEKFFVTGASKRGWTTWLTGAADRRVTGIMPMVIDVLDMKTQMQHHIDSYGYFAPAVYDYCQMNIFERLLKANFDDSKDPAANLLKIVDPYQYRGRFGKTAKYIITATGDEFFLSDAAEKYIYNLPGPTYLHSVPNTQHSLEDDAAITSLAGFYNAHVMYARIPKTTFTSYDSYSGSYSIQLQTDTSPLSVNLWQAYNSKGRDFRIDTIGKAWYKTTLPNNWDNIYTATVEYPEINEGWKAMMVQAKFYSPLYGCPYVFNSPIHVLWPGGPSGLKKYPAFSGKRKSMDGFAHRDIPLLVLYGTPFEMGVDYGSLMSQEIGEFIPSFLQKAAIMDPTLNETALKNAWNTMAPGVAPRIKEEMNGIAQGAGIDISLLQQAYAVPIMMSSLYTSEGSTYNRGSLAALWGESLTPDINDNKFLIENLDWPLSLGAQNYPCVILYIPSDGLPHVNVTFAGMVGCYAGINLAGIAAGQMCISPDTDRPFNVTGTDSSSLMRAMLYTSQRMSAVGSSMSSVQRNKRQIYLAADSYWEDEVSEFVSILNTPVSQSYLGSYYINEPTGLGEEYIKLKGKCDIASLCELASQMALKGTNAMSVMFNPTQFECWVAYGLDNTDAKSTGYLHIDFKNYMP
jgi:hypothetical protein